MLIQIFIIIISYLLGSFPSGFIIAKFSGKNVLEMGWRKTSGSNVFKNVGKWQGILTGILDIGKGFLAVWLAKTFGFSVEIQIACGVLAVVGHNWSCFLGFAGGRGIATFGGALLAFSPILFIYSVIIILVIALIWNAAIGTIILLLADIILSFCLNQFESTGIFIFLSLIFIFMKRLSPVKELSLKNKEVIRNRLIFDDDLPRFDLRIKRLFNKLTDK